MSAKVAAGVDPVKARKMITYRWITYGMFLLTYIFVYFDRVSPAVVAPELMKEFGLTATTLGILSSMYFYPYAAMQFPSGVLSDKIGPRLSVSFFFVIAAIGTALFGLAQTFGWCIFGRFLMGVGVAVVWMPCMKILYNWFRPNELATLTGVMLTLGNVGAILASAPLAFLVGIVGWRNSFLWLGAFMILISIVDYLIVRNKPADMGYPTVSEIDGIDYYPAQTAAQKTTFKENFLKLLKMKNYWLISLYAFVIYGTVMGFQGLWFIPYAQQIYGMPKQQAANMLMFWPIGMALGCFAAGYASDRILKSRRKHIFLGHDYLRCHLDTDSFLYRINPHCVVLSLVICHGLFLWRIRAQLCTHRRRSADQLHGNIQRDAEYMVLRRRGFISGIDGRCA